MSRHYDRSGHFLVGEGFLGADPLLPDSNEFMTAAPPPPGAGAGAGDERRAFKFGRMFDELKAPAVSDEAKYRELLGLMELGQAMNVIPQGMGVSGGVPKDDAQVPSGYTYLGQFVAHDISFDRTKDLPTEQIDDLEQIEQGRSPSIDLDSLYGRGPQDECHRKYYQDHARLKVGETFPTKDWEVTILFDLPRDSQQAGRPRAALIPDQRNDENLALAQTHLAFIKFHNKVVDKLAGEGVPEAEQFERARACVVRHFQWVVLRHFLPRVVEQDVLDCVEGSALRHGSPKFFRPSPTYGLFMPVEFSAAAYRLGHSMVRGTYEWNRFNDSETGLGAATVVDLFTRTGFSGDLGGHPRLESKWVIDWRRFYDFSEVGAGGGRRPNRAKRIDTNFNFQLNTIPLYPHIVREAFRPLTVRNLIRGFALRLPTGQAVAERAGAEVLGPDLIAQGPHRQVLTSYNFHKRTPLWYYVLKEAEVAHAGERLGPVGSRLIAETFVGLIMKSRYSILAGWEPELGERAADKKFDMTDLLKYTGIINPMPPP